jgi:hypothetical protein
MHLTQPKAFAVAILLEGIVIFALFVVFMYYAFQAQANMKPDSPWKLRLEVTWKEAWQRHKARGWRVFPPAANLRNWDFGTIAALLFGELSLPSAGLRSGLSTPH